MGAKKNTGVCIYGAEVILRYLSAFQKECSGTLRSRDIEFVHRMRVASRRLSTALALFRDCYPDKRMRLWQKDIRQATRMLGRARDLDIQTASVKGYLKGLSETAKRPGVRRLLLRIVQRRQRAQKKLQVVMDELDRHQIPIAIDAKSQALKKIKTGRLPQDISDLPTFACKAIIPVLDKFLEFDPFVDQVEAVEELHAMRLAAKSLRYTLECFTSLYNDELGEFLSIMRKTQEHLGIIHDCDIWESSKEQFIEDECQRTIKYFGSNRSMRCLMPGLVGFFEYQRAQRNEYYNAFVSFWNELRERQIWDMLRKKIESSHRSLKQVPSG